MKTVKMFIVIGFVFTSYSVSLAANDAKKIMPLIINEEDAPLGPVTPDAGNEIVNGSYIYLEAYKADVATANKSKLKAWVSNLDKVYQSYVGLVGRIPDDGYKVGFKVNESSGCFGSNSTPINVCSRSMTEYVSNPGDDWGMGFMHELGHHFEYEGKWNFDGEHWANFKVLYAVKELGANVIMNGKTYVGNDFDDYWEEQCIQTQNQYDAIPDSHKRLSCSQIPAVHVNNDDNSSNNLRKYNDCTTHIFNKIHDTIGWKPFMKTFREFNDGDANQTLQQNVKYELYMSTLQNNTSTDVMSLISEQDQLNMKYYMCRSASNY
ncbi:MAG: hypothetical protein OCD01_05210 [Fibrobacterales bacterium]